MELHRGQPFSGFSGFLELNWTIPEISANPMTPLRLTPLPTLGDPKTHVPLS